MTRDEFESAYAARSGMTVDRLHELGRRAYPCRCLEEICEGWQMISHEAAQTEIELGRLTLEEVRIITEGERK